MEKICPECNGKLVMKRGNVYFCLSCGRLYHGKKDLKDAKQREKWRRYIKKKNRYY